jgi:hypothetical protein
VRVAAEPTAREDRGEIVILAAHPHFAEEMERRFFRAGDGALVCRNERFTLQP